MAMPLGHGSQVQRVRPLARRERLLAGGVGAAVAVAAVVLLVVTLTAPAHRSGRGCVAVSLAYSLGGTQTYRCGAGARALCASVGHPGGLTGVGARDAARECRRAGLSVG